jgi:hypothetical protein
MKYRSRRRYHFVVCRKPQQASNKINGGVLRILVSYVWSSTMTISASYSSVRTVLVCSSIESIIQICTVHVLPWWSRRQLASSTTTVQSPLVYHYHYDLFNLATLNTAIIAPKCQNVNGHIALVIMSRHRVSCMCVHTKHVQNLLIFVKGLYNEYEYLGLEYSSLGLSPPTWNSWRLWKRSCRNLDYFRR